MTTTQKLGWGASWLVPEDATAAWGARLIVRQDGYVDLVSDRTDMIGDDENRQRLINHLTGRRADQRYSEASPLKQALDHLEQMLKKREVSTREAKEVTVYEDDTVLVRGNSNASAGYFYIAAWLKEEK